MTNRQKDIIKGTHMKVSDYIEENILNLITERNYKSGDRLDPIRSLAQELDTSKYTMNHALKELADKGILYQKDGKRGYFIARSSKRITNENKTVGLVLGILKNQDPTQYPFSMFYDSIPIMQQTLLGEHIALLSLGGLIHEKGNASLIAPESILSRDLDGMLLFGIYNFRFISRLAAEQEAIIALDIDTTDIFVDCVCFDNITSSVTMVKHLAEQGAERIAFLGGPFPPLKERVNQNYYDPCAHERFDGWRAGMCAAGLKIDPDLICINPIREAGSVADRAEFLLNSKERPDAIVTESSHAVIQAMKKKGIAPGEIKLAGWASGDIGKNLEHLSPYIDVVSVIDYQKLALKGVEFMLWRMENPDEQVKRELLSPAVVNSKGKVLVG
jgi:DNA-binding LacI/PurR family transcriptional regulator